MNVTMRENEKYRVFVSEVAKEMGVFEFEPDKMVWRYTNGAGFLGIARSTRHFLEVLDDLNRMEVEFISFRKNIDTAGPLGRAIVIIGAIAELERSLIVERVRAGMRRARLDGLRIGRAPLVLDNLTIHQDRQRGQSIREIARGHSVSTATKQRVLRKTA